ncbi:hypothetical protein ACTFIZ_011384 [Dictyostelium cf. discoideum]
MTILEFLDNYKNQLYKSDRYFSYIYLLSSFILSLSISKCLLYNQLSFFKLIKILIPEFIFLELINYLKINNNKNNNQNNYLLFIKGLLNTLNYLIIMPLIIYTQNNKSFHWFQIFHYYFIFLLGSIQVIHCNYLNFLATIIGENNSFNLFFGYIHLTYLYCIYLSIIYNNKYLLLPLLSIISLKTLYKKTKKYKGDGLYTFNHAKPVIDVIEGLTLHMIDNIDDHQLNQNLAATITISESNNTLNDNSILTTKSNKHQWYHITIIGNHFNHDTINKTYFQYDCGNMKSKVNCLYESSSILICPHSIASSKDVKCKLILNGKDINQVTTISYQVLTVLN